MSPDRLSWNDYRHAGTKNALFNAIGNLHDLINDGTITTNEVGGISVTIATGELEITGGTIGCITCTLNVNVIAQLPAGTNTIGVTQTNLTCETFDFFNALSTISAIGNSSGVGNTFDVSKYRELNVFLSASSFSALATLGMEIETKCPISGNWFSIHDFGDITTASYIMATIPSNLGNTIRASYTFDNTIVIHLGAVAKS